MSSYKGTIYRVSALVKVTIWVRVLDRIGLGYCAAVRLSSHTSLSSTVCVALAVVTSAVPARRGGGL